MKKILIILALIALLFPAITNASVSDATKGKILLQVESHGEAWYVHPNTRHRHYMGRPDDAFNIMRELGLGVAHNELTNYLSSTFPSRLSGLIMLDVESHGEAYYVFPSDLKGYYLGRPEDAFKIMREKSLGISNNDLDKITIDDSSDIPQNTHNEHEDEASQNQCPDNSHMYAVCACDTGYEFNDERTECLLEGSQSNSPYATIEAETYNIVNAHRLSIGSGTLTWNSDIADIAREHSVNMALGIVNPPSHEGFSERMDAIQLIIPTYNGGAENLAWNHGYADPAQAGLDWWLTSPAHKTSLENDFYNMTGIGVAKATNEYYYITQLFINSN